jgi:IMP dehydrogenase/GMP reductase
MKFDFDDITLVPTVMSTIESRYRSISLTRIQNSLPVKEYRLMTAPMDTVIDGKNAHEYDNRDISMVLPRSQFVDGRKYVNPVFISFSLKEFENSLNLKKINGDSFFDDTEYVCLDIANGHMEKVYNFTTRFKRLYPDKKLMVGNIANPETYKILSNAGADYIRCSVGTGSGCLSAEQTAIYYPMASLIKECRDESMKLDNPAFIVADGGMRKYADIIKALNLGADFVMIGGMFNKMVESNSRSYLWKTFPVSKKFAYKHYKRFKLFKKFRGMSTKEVQREWGKPNVRTSEGIVKWNRVRYDLSSWIENYEHYLRSAMSYSGTTTMDEFIGKQNFIRITSNAYRRFNK